MYYDYDTGLPRMFGTSSADAACNLLVSASTVYYTSSLALTNGTPLYYDECLTIPITASAYTTSSQQYFKIGPYYVNFETNGYVVRDVTVCTSPTTTTTTSTTTTTTTADPYYYYSVSKFDCGSSCAYVSPDLVARSSTPLSTIDGVYYKPLGSFTYQIQNEITPAPMSFDISLDGAPSNANCISACSL
jgi:hypothetical protein